MGFEYHLATSRTNTRLGPESEQHANHGRPRTTTRNAGLTHSLQASARAHLSGRVALSLGFGLLYGASNPQINELRVDNGACVVRAASLFGTGDIGLRLFIPIDLAS